MKLRNGALAIVAMVGVALISGCSTAPKKMKAML